MPRIVRGRGLPPVLGMADTPDSDTAGSTPDVEPPPGEPLEDPLDEVEPASALLVPAVPEFEVAVVPAFAVVVPDTGAPVDVPPFGGGGAAV